MKTTTEILWAWKCRWDFDPQPTAGASSLLMRINCIGKRYSESVLRTILLLPIMLLASLYGVSATAESTGQIHGRVTMLDAGGVTLKDHSNVVVFVEGVPAGVAKPAVAAPPRVSHLYRTFSPRVLPIVRGSQVDFFNDDNIYHNVFSVSRAKPFDLGIYPEGTSKLVTFAKPGLVKLYCNIHPKMIANVLVLNNELFSVTDKGGEYSIDNIPEGEFTLRFWHEFSEEASSTVSISAATPTEKNIELHATKRIKQHKNKFGKSYRSKY